MSYNPFIETKSEVDIFGCINFKVLRRVNINNLFNFLKF